MQPRNNRDVANCVECYASEHKVTEEVAFAAIDSMIEDEWKTTNQARFKHGRELLPAVQRVINFTLTGRCTTVIGKMLSPSARILKTSSRASLSIPFPSSYYSANLMQACIKYLFSYGPSISVCFPYPVFN